MKYLLDSRCRDQRSRISWKVLFTWLELGVLLAIIPFKFAQGEGSQGENDVQAPITAVALDLQNRLTVDGSQTGLHVRKWPDLELIQSLETKLENIHDLSISPDGSMLAVGGGVPAQSGTIELFSWPSGVLIRRTELHSDLVMSISWNSESNHLAVASMDNGVSILNVATGKTITRLDDHSRGVLSVAFRPDSWELVSGGIDESIRYWEIAESGKGDAIEKRSLTNHTRSVTNLKFAPHTENGIPLLASTGDDQTVRFWQPTIGRMVRFARLKSPATSICWTRDGKHLWVTCQSGVLCKVETATGRTDRELLGLGNSALCMDLADDQTLLIGGDNGALKRIVVESP